MKVVAFNGSARKGGNTANLLQMVLGELDKEGATTELVELSGKPVQGCIACFKCHENKDQRCAVTNDVLNDCIVKMLDADAILLGSPTYFGDASATMRGLIERAGMVARANEHMFRRKVGAAVVAVRRCGAMQVFNSINAFFTISQIYVVSSSYWNMGRGLKPGEVKEDQEAADTMRDLGQNMAWLLRKLHA
jgi:multimeric flavodoxin WrbA